MQLSESDATATIAVKHLDTASSFYEGLLGLKPVTRIPGAITYRSGRSDVLLYESQFAGTNRATAVTWVVADVDGLVRSLKAKGIRFEHYDLPDTRRQGDVHVAGGVKVAWFKDPDGNIISLVNQQDRVLLIDRVLDAPRDVVFRAWTEPERAKRWWGPRDFTAPSVELADHAGGAWRAIMRSPEGKNFPQHGIVRELKRPERLVFTLTWDEEPDNEMLVTATFTERDGKTHLGFRQDGFKTVESRDSHAKGWSESLDRLQQYLTRERVPTGVSV